MSQIYNNLQLLQSIASRNEKIAAVTEMLRDSVDFYKFGSLALNPFINFGFSKIPTYQRGDTLIDLTDTYSVFDYLSKVNRSNETVAKVVDTLSKLSEQDAYCFERVLLKDLRCGVQLSTFNNAIDKCNQLYNTNYVRLVDYPCMLVASYSEKLINKLDFTNKQFPIICQQKCDGMRFNAVVVDQKVSFYGRSGKPINITDQQFINSFIQLANNTNVVFDGELLVRYNGKILDRKTGNGILNKAVKGTISDKEQQLIVATLWDTIPFTDFYSGRQKDEQTNYYFNRWNRLIDLFNNNSIETDRIKLVESTTIDTIDQGLAMFKRMLQAGEEGVIVKSGTNIWKDTRVSDCVKLKAELDCDLRIIEVYEGTGKYQNALGSIECATDDKKVVVGVGSGFTEQQRQDLWKIKDQLIGKIVTVKYNGRINDKNTSFDSLFLPRFIEIREDKEQPNLSEEIK